MIEFSIEDHGPRSIQTPPTAIHMPTSKTDWSAATTRPEQIDFKKYENWLRCMNLTRATHLLELVATDWDTIYVRYNNNPEPCQKLMTSISSIASNPVFLLARPRNIWCSFEGGPYNKLMVRSSLLNYIVDRVYQNILKEGVRATDDKIIEALNFKPTLLLTGPQ